MIRLASSLRILALVLVAMVWGAALHAALFSGPSSVPGYEDDYLAVLLEAAEKRGANQLRQPQVERPERRREMSPPIQEGPGRKRRLNGAREPVWKPTISDQPRVVGKDFSIHEPFNFPLPHHSRRKRDLLQSPWVDDLQAFLRGVRGTQVSMVTASVEHQDVLMNWLISATLVASPPLQNILVLTLDRSVFRLVSRRNISTLYVSEGMVLSPSANVTRRFSQVHVVRLTVLRLLNHYGFSVVNYDCDAILLKNPQPIFDGHKDADLIGTFGKGPGQLYVKWGITLNTGVMLLRSNPKIEYYWELMSREMSRGHSSTDDQANINLALDRANIRWFNFDKSNNIDFLSRAVYGLADEDIIVMLMPENVVCRYICDPNQRSDYYVWHTFAIKENRTVVNKMSQAKVGNAWFLRSDWSTASQEAGPHVVGVAWLRHIANPNLVR